MRVNRIDHINIRTPLLEETVSFFERLLKLDRGRAAGMDQARNAWLYDSSRHPIVHVNMPHPDEESLPTVNTGRLDHVAFDCVGYEEAISVLAEMTVPYRTNHVAEIDLRQIFLVDPNGIRVELNFRNSG